MRECLDRHKGGCDGEVEGMPSLAGTGTIIFRCDAHWDARFEEQERIDEAYPDSPIAPSWFDESFAGERWDSDY